MQEILQNRWRNKFFNLGLALIAGLEIVAPKQMNNSRWDEIMMSGLTSPVISLDSGQEQNLNFPSAKDFLFGGNFQNENKCESIGFDEIYLWEKNNGLVDVQGKESGFFYVGYHLNGQGRESGNLSVLYFASANFFSRSIFSETRQNETLGFIVGVKNDSAQRLFELIDRYRKSFGVDPSVDDLFVLLLQSPELEGVPVVELQARDSGTCFLGTEKNYSGLPQKNDVVVYADNFVVAQDGSYLFYDEQNNPKIKLRGCAEAPLLDSVFYHNGFGEMVDGHIKKTQDGKIYWDNTFNGPVLEGLLPNGQRAWAYLRCLDDGTYSWVSAVDLPTQKKSEDQAVGGGVFEKNAIPEDTDEGRFEKYGLNWVKRVTREGYVFYVSGEKEVFIKTYQKINGKVELVEKKVKAKLNIDNIAKILLLFASKEGEGNKQKVVNYLQNQGVYVNLDFENKNGDFTNNIFAGYNYLDFFHDNGTKIPFVNLGSQALIGYLERNQYFNFLQNKPIVEGRFNGYEVLVHEFFHMYQMIRDIDWYMLFSSTLKPVFVVGPTLIAFLWGCRKGGWASGLFCGLGVFAFFSTCAPYVFTDPFETEANSVSIEFISNHEYNDIIANLLTYDFVD